MSTTTRVCRQTARPASTAWTSTACTLRLRRCSPISTRSIRSAARRARERYACFDHFGDNPQVYGHAPRLRHQPNRARTKWSTTAGRAAASAKPSILSATAGVAEDEFFFAEQNARLVKNAEQYYRSMFRGPVSSWNLRDQHMVETLDSLVLHLNEQHGRAKIVVWAHNSHLGDARATEMGVIGELNVGQLMRERHPQETYGHWVHYLRRHGDRRRRMGQPARRRRVRPALPGSYEDLLHQASAIAETDLMLDLRNQGAATEAPHRTASGACYRRHLQARNGAIQSLFPRHHAQAVRHRAAHRPHVRRAADRRRPWIRITRRNARDLAIRGLTKVAESGVIGCRSGDETRAGTSHLLEEAGTLAAASALARLGRAQSHTRGD